MPTTMTDAELAYQAEQTRNLQMMYQREWERRRNNNQGANTGQFNNY